MFFGLNWLPQLQPVPALAASGSPAARRSSARRRDELLDEALKGTFPASDPIGLVRIS